MKTICLNCGNETPEIEKQKEISIVIKEKKVKIMISCFICEVCGMDYATSEQMNKTLTLLKPYKSELLTPKPQIVNNEVVACGTPGNCSLCDISLYCPWRSKK